MGNLHCEKMKKTKTIAMTTLVFLFLFNVSCSKQASDDNKDNSPHTGFESTESDVVSISERISSTTAKSGTTAYVYAERLRARTTPEIASSNIAGVLDLNDQVTIIDSKPIGFEEFVKVEVKQSKGETLGQVVFVSSKYLSSKKRVLNAQQSTSQKYFMVQNIATEMVRVYERCQPNEKCINKMIFQTGLIAGEDEPARRTQLGTYKIDRWMKFYEELSKKNPAWYRPNYPPLPSPHASAQDWINDEIMPGGRGETRGAYGWYTAILSPNAAAQWTHGTMGWGADKDYYIKFRKTFMIKFVNLFKAIRSHGCTQIDNEGIAYLRQLLPVGSTIIKIYAEETLFNENLPRYSKNKKKWDYILTKKGYGTSGGQSADAATVLAEKTPASEWIEQGQYEVDQYPEMHEGNLYEIDNDEFKGVFVVDEGTVFKYEHPKSLRVGGLKDQVVPSYMVFKDPELVK